MGVQGVPHNITKKALKAAIKSKKGVASKVQEQLGISHGLFYKLLDEYELRELLAEERNASSERMCDIAEDVLIRGMEQTEDMRNALGAAKYVLNNKGRERGYYPPVIPLEYNENQKTHVLQLAEHLTNESITKTEAGDKDSE